MKMKFVLCFSVLASVITTERTKFELATLFNDLALPDDFTVGPAVHYSQPDKCARDCVRNTNCSMFSFNKTGHSCQLYGNVVHSAVHKAEPKTGARYYAYRRDWCPMKNNFYMFRSINLCVKLFMMRVDYYSANSTCTKFKSRLLLLENENDNKAASITSVLQTLDMYSIYVGANDIEQEGNFVWMDGRNVSSGWWVPDEPNDSGGFEDCAELVQGGMNDVGCGTELRFICEIIR